MSDEEGERQLPTLDEFIQQAWADLWPTSSSFVREPGFKELYVRRTLRFLNYDLERSVTTLDIARIAADDPGHGAFTALAERLLARGLPLYVECVHNPRFAKKLRRMGFSVSPINPDSYYKLPSGWH
jgi:hypothetical protein